MMEPAVYISYLDAEKKHILNKYSAIDCHACHYTAEELIKKAETAQATKRAAYAFTLHYPEADGYKAITIRGMNETTRAKETAVAYIKRVFGRSEEQLTLF